jgi:hypothetical protein
MKISEYIKQLEEIKEKHGDLPVYYTSSNDDEYESMGPCVEESIGKPTDCWHRPKRVLT